MKKLFAPILVLTLIVGFSALALGAGTEASGTQTLTVDVEADYLITTTENTNSFTVGPRASVAGTDLGTITCKTNDENSSLDLQVAVDEGSSTWPSGLKVTVKPPGTILTQNTANYELTAITDGGTLLATSGGTFTAGPGSSQTVNADLSTVNWDAPSSINNASITLVYKFVSS